MKLFRIRTGMVMTGIARKDIFRTDHEDEPRTKQDPGSGAMGNQTRYQKVKGGWNDGTCNIDHIDRDRADFVLQ